MLKTEGEAINKTSLLYNIGYNLIIHCLSMGGYPEPILEWYKDLKPFGTRLESYKLFLGSNKINCIY